MTGEKVTIKADYGGAKASKFLCFIFIIYLVIFAKLWGMAYSYKNVGCPEKLSGAETCSLT